MDRTELLQTLRDIVARSVGNEVSEIDETKNLREDLGLDSIDLAMKECLRLRAPVPVVHVKRTEERPGGAANVARNITALESQATLLAVVGDDEAGASLERLVRAENVDCSLHRDAALSTTV